MNFSLPTSDAKVKKEGFEIPYGSLQRNASMGGGGGRDEFMSQSASNNASNLFGNMSNGLWNNTISSHFGRSHDFGGITDEDLSSITNGGSNFGFNPLANNSHLGHQSASAPVNGNNNHNYGAANTNLQHLFNHSNSYNNSLDISTGVQASSPSSFGQSGSYNSSMFDHSHRNNDAFYSNTPDTSVSTIPPSSIRSQSRSSNGGKVPSSRSRVTKKTTESSTNSSTSPYSNGSPHLPTVPGHVRRPSTGAMQSVGLGFGGNNNAAYSMDTNDESAVADDDLPGATKTKAEILAEKKKKRRESHNEVERRRRDNINERISELSDLLPDNVESLANNYNVPFAGILSPVVGHATLHEEEDYSGAKGDKGKANKGDVLKHSVDYIKYLQKLVEAQSKELQSVRMAASPVSSQGGNGSLQHYAASTGSMPNFASPDNSHLNFTSWVDATASPDTMEAISADEGERGRPLMRHAGMEE